MYDAFEQVVAENRQLRKQVKTLNERVAALESSRWWRLHPRVLLKRVHSRPESEAPLVSPAKVKRVAQVWRLRTEYERRSAEGAPDEVVIREGIRLKAHPEARGTFEQFCYSAPEQVEELDVFLANTADRRRLLDIGAFHGIFSLVFTINDASKRALAVDASPVAFPKLLYNIHRNRAENVTAVECALSNEPGILDMHYTWGQFAVAGTGAKGASLRVETTTGDELCARYAFEPDVVKIDVEGHELRVIQGLRETIRRNRPLLFLEVHPALIRADPRNGTPGELIEELCNLGYPAAADIDRRIKSARDPVEEGEERLLLRPELRSP